MIKEQNKLMKERQCFRCRKTGHMSKDCTPGLVKPDGKTTFTQIWALIAQLDQEEKAKLRESAEDWIFDLENYLNVSIS